MESNNPNSLYIYLKSISAWITFTCTLAYFQVIYIVKVPELIIQHFIAPTIAGLLFGVLTGRIISLNNQLKLFSTRDALTGAFNHGYGQEKLNNWCEKNVAFSLIVFDVDDFKKINDQYGHKVGDETLIRLSDLVSKTKRVYDIFSRYGGEEFILMTPRTELKTAAATGERIRKTISEAIMPKDFKLTCSFGVAEFKAGVDTPDTLFERADKAMYYSKNNGKNCVTLEKF